jgi:hypothetical protein
MMATLYGCPDVTPHPSVASEGSDALSGASHGGYRMGAADEEKTQGLPKGLPESEDVCLAPAGEASIN